MKSLLKKVRLTVMGIFVLNALITAQIPHQIKDARTGKLIQMKTVNLTNKTTKSSRLSLPASTSSLAPSQTMGESQNGGIKSSLQRNIAPSEVKNTIVSERKDRGCTTQRVKAAIGMKDMALFTSNTNKIYPFSLIDGSTILSGAYATKSFKRNPVILYSDLPVANPDDAAVVVSEPNASNVQKAILKLSQSKLSGPQVANQSFSSSEISNKEDFKLQLNVHAEGFWNASIDNSFSFSSNKSDYTLLAEFEQLYFSVNVNDFPVNPKDIFAEDIGVIPNDLVYVSSVTYGRKAIVTINIQNTTKEIVNKLNIAIKAGLKKVNIDSDLELKNALKTTTMSGFVFGGNPNSASAIALLGSPEQVIESLNKYISEGATYNVSNPGVPLYYTLNFVNDNSTCGVFQTLDKDVQKCSNSLVFDVTAKGIRGVRPDDADDKEDDLYGGLGVSINPPLQYAEGGSGEKEIWRIVYPERKGTNLGARFITLRANQTVDFSAGGSRIIRRIMVPRSNINNANCTILTSGKIIIDDKVPNSRAGDRGLEEWDPRGTDNRFMAQNGITINFNDVLNAKVKTYEQLWKCGPASHIMIYEAKYIEE